MRFSVAARSSLVAADFEASLVMVVAMVTRYDVISRWWSNTCLFQLNSTIKVIKVAKIMQSTYLCVIFHAKHKKLTFVAVLTSLRTADAFSVVASLPPQKKKRKEKFSEGEKRRPEMSLLFGG